MPSALHGIESRAELIIVLSILGILALSVLIGLCVWQSRQQPQSRQPHNDTPVTPSVPNSPEKQTPCQP
jgi:hypothetical protein